jgi:hypothetical protein
MPPEDAIVADYRLYHLDKSGHVAGPPDGLTCDNDETAIERARRLLDDHDLELWQRDRLVMRLHALRSDLSSRLIKKTAPCPHRPQTSSRLAAAFPELNISVPVGDEGA